MKPIPPGSTIGILGSGQLGRMLAIEARLMGYRIECLSPEADSPTGQIADKEHVASYLDLDAIRNFAKSVDVITFEFENVPSRTTEVAAEFTPVRPRGEVLHITQHRLREKTFLSNAGLPVAPFRHIKDETELRTALVELGYPAVLKTAGFGYDGKGQVRIESESDIARAGDALSHGECVLEGFVQFEKEISVIAARGVDGSYADYGAVENIHKNHILDITIAPARISESVAHRARALAKSILETLDVVGVLGVEMFLKQDGEIIVNELAPRTHNSGHFTLDANITSQFAQQLRAVCGLPLGSSEQLRPAVMVNLLGDLWNNGEPDWAAACQIDGANIHLYGKRDAKPGRKMGHITALATTIEEAKYNALEARRRLTH